MERYFYLNSSNEQMGPIAPTDFEHCGITKDSMLWKQGMTEWSKAGEIPELAQYFGLTSPPPPSHGNNNAGNSSNNNSGSQQNKPMKPDNNMHWAILSTIFCCLPLGIYSIILASRVNSLYYSGRYHEAEGTAENVKKWAKISALVGLIILVIYWAFYLAIIAHFTY